MLLRYANGKTNDRTLQRQTRRQDDRRDFPFIVEIAVPPDGLGKRLNAMHACHNQRGVKVAHIRHRHEDDRDHLLWCFARRAIAEEFAVKFGGTLVG